MESRVFLPGVPMQQESKGKFLNILIGYRVSLEDKFSLCNAS
jgi:hypothetical protein